jgi:hypothetical protein
MINIKTVYLMIAAVLSVSLGTISNGVMPNAAASPESDSGNNSSTEGAGVEKESDQEEVKGSEEDSSGTAPPEETPANIEQPAATEQPAAELPKCDGSPQDCITKNGDICLEGQGGHECECAEDMSDCPNHPSLIGPPITEPGEPLPYCDLIPSVAQNYSCHDRRDYDDITGLYSCNDGTQKEDWRDCADVSRADYEEFKNQEPIDPCLLDPDNSPTCPPPVDGQCSEGYNMNENGNCFPEHNRCPTGYHSHEDDESGRCILDSTPCDEGYTMNPDFPSCDLKERVCEENPWLIACGGNGQEPDKEETIHNTKDFPDVDIIGLSIKDNGDAIVCIMNIDEDWVQCQEFGVPDNRINEDV